MSNELESELARVERERLEFERMKHARERWWYEESLINQRLSWFFAAEGLLGLGYAWLKYRIAEVAAGSAGVSNPVMYSAQLESLSRFLLVLGLLVAVFALLGIWAAAHAQQVMKEDPDNARFKLDVSPLTTSVGRLAAYSIPLLCIGSWLASFVFLQRG